MRAHSKCASIVVACSHVTHKAYASVCHLFWSPCRAPLFPFEMPSRFQRVFAAIFDVFFVIKKRFLSFVHMFIWCDILCIMSQSNQLIPIKIRKSKWKTLSTSGNCAANRRTVAWIYDFHFISVSLFISQSQWKVTMHRCTVWDWFTFTSRSINFCSSLRTHLQITSKLWKILTEVKLHLSKALAFVLSTVNTHSHVDAICRLNYKCFPFSWVSIWMAFINAFANNVVCNIHRTCVDSFAIFKAFSFRKWNMRRKFSSVVTGKWQPEWN